MFTGIITALGEVREARPIGTGGGDMRLVVALPAATAPAAMPVPALGPDWPAAAAAGSLLLLAAQPPLDEAGAPVSGGVAAQAEACLNRLLAVLEAHGAGPDAIARLGLSLRDPGDLEAVAGVLSLRLTAPLPAVTPLLAPALPAGQLVQIEATARAPAAGSFLRGTALGASIACSGCCLTVVEQGSDWFAADVSAETLGLTTLGAWSVGTPLNLERSLRLGDELGGHMVSGHVDGLAHLVSRTPENGSLRLSFRLPPPLAGRLITKGSVALDGVSLTVNVQEGDTFAVNVIPHTAAVTTLGRLHPGDAANVELDRSAHPAAPPGPWSAPPGHGPGDGAGRDGAGDPLPGRMAREGAGPWT